MKPILTSLLLVMSMAHGVAQSIVLAPVHYTNQSLDSLCNITSQQESVLNSLDRKERKKAEELFEGRSEFLRSLMMQGYFIYESPVLDYINTLYTKLSEANPEIGSDYLILLSRSNTINAFSAGNKILVVNLGLFNQVQSVDELVFVIAHELAHEVRAHSDEKILAHAREVTNEERQDEIKKILKNEYRVYSKLKEYFLPGMMAQMQYSRLREFEADSLGMGYALKAGFSLEGGIDCLKMLDRSDEYLYSNAFDWHGYVSQHHCAVHPYWQSDNSGSLGSFQIERPSYEDRLKSHPDCQDRILALKSNFQNKKNPSLADIRAEFASIKRQAEYELVAAGFVINNYSYAIYHAVHHLQVDSADMPMRGLLSLLMADLAYSKSIWKAGSVLSQPDIENQPSDYYDFLTVLWELSPEETTCIASGLREICKNDIPEGWNLAITALTSYAQGQKSAADKAAGDYLTENPNGWYHKQMRDLINRQ